MDDTKNKDERIEAEPGSAARMIKQVKRHTKKRYTSEEKIRIVLEGFRKELSVAELCRREGIHAQVYYGWLKDFMEAGKERLSGDVVRQANKGEVKDLKKENERLKLAIGDMALENSLLKKIMKK